jgi:carbon-monoxide dehydrogenase small subunit
MKRAIRLTVNGQWLTGEAEPRTSLADFLREQLDLTGTHVGCEHGVCGACTVLLDGEPVRSCLMLAVQAAGRSLMTIEGLAGAGSGLVGLAGAAGPGGDEGETLHPLQEAFRQKHGLQCGYCTPGILLTAYAFLRENPAPTEVEIREMLAGNLCRCTGYHFIVEAIAEAARTMRA